MNGLVGSAATSVLALAAALLASAGCGDTITILECPPGTEPRGSECVPWGTPDVEPPADTKQDETSGLLDLPLADLSVTPDPGPEDPGGGTDADAAPPKDVVPDVDTGPLLGGVGAACNKNADCEGGTCLEWEGGYCTRLDCTESGCPSGSLCMPLLGGNTGCMTTCQAQGNCRPGGEQACKVVPGLDGGGKSVCHGLSDGAGVIGATCANPADCLGSALCLPLMPGGYCGIQPCDAASCPLGAACVKYEGKPTCMQTCSSDLDCESSEGQERACGTLKDLSQVNTDVCVSATKTKAVGASCQTNVECQTGLCQILGEGRCSQANTPCFSEANCPGVESCLITPANKVGICTQECSMTKACPGLSYCVGDPGLPSGWCRPPCDDLGDADCRPQDGFACTYGYALGDSSGQGRYLCGGQKAGQLGQPCASGADCATGACAMGSSGSGMCQGPCTNDLYCAFPGTCVSGASTLTCAKACQSNDDCGAGFQCGTVPGTVRPVCF